MGNLAGRRLPSCLLPSTQGGIIDPSTLNGHAVLFCYPYTGRPGVPDPVDWDAIPGAHGSTPQCIGYSERYLDFQNLDVKLFGVSGLSTEWQHEFAERMALKVPLLSDAAGQFADALSLSVFAAGDRKFLRRLTIISRDGVIVGTHEPGDPARDASEALSLFKRP